MQQFIKRLNKRHSIIDRLINLYFQTGFNNKEILTLLAHSHRLVISLKRGMKSLGLFRRKNHSDLLDVAMFILQQHEESGALHGYRWMHLMCIRAGFNIPRDTVYQLLQLLDAKGIKSRLRKRLKRQRYSSSGPNFVWHTDSYDKLKPYGIAINGCIDGYSRCIIWLEAGTTNNDPKVIANYYIKAVEEKDDCPQRIRADLGTENVHIEAMQKFLRRNHEDAFASERNFIYGKSTHNQRIEWFWGILRKEIGQFYMDLFAYFSRDGIDLFCGDMLDKNLNQFCFLQIIQAGLAELQDTWNMHTLQSKPGGLGGGKRPILLYTVPQLYNAIDHICPADDNEVHICGGETTPKVSPCSDETVFELCTLIMEENRMLEPNNVTEARELYTQLRQIIRYELDNC